MRNAGCCAVRMPQAMRARPTPWRRGISLACTTSKRLSACGRAVDGGRKQNIPEALFDLAVSYEKGAGVRKSERKAYHLYVRAALWGDKQAIHEVGRCLFYGIGAKRDRRLADVWLARAEALGVS